MSCKCLVLPPARAAALHTVQVKNFLLDLHKLDQTMQDVVFFNIIDCCIYMNNSTTCLTSHRSPIQADRMLERLCVDIGLTMVGGRCVWAGCLGEGRAQGLGAG